jgi:hypothetical protein
VPKTPISGAGLERNQVPLSAEITCRFRPKSGAGLLRFLHISETVRWLGYRPSYSLATLLSELAIYGDSGPPQPTQA